MSELDEIIKNMEAFLDGEEEEIPMDYGDILTIYNALLKSTGRIMTLADFISVFNTDAPLDLLIYDSENNFRVGYHGKETISKELLSARVLSAIDINSIGVKLNITIDEGED